MSLQERGRARWISTITGSYGCKLLVGNVGSSNPNSAREPLLDLLTLSCTWLYQGIKASTLPIICITHYELSLNKQKLLTMNPTMYMHCIIRARRLDLWKWLHSELLILLLTAHRAQHGSCRRVSLLTALYKTHAASPPGLDHVLVGEHIPTCIRSVYTQLSH